MASWASSRSRSASPKAGAAVFPPAVPARCSGGSPSRRWGPGSGRSPPGDGPAPPRPRPPGPRRTGAPPPGPTPAPAPGGPGPAPRRPGPTTPAPPTAGAWSLHSASSSWARTCPWETRTPSSTRMAATIPGLFRDHLHLLPGPEVGGGPEGHLQVTRLHHDGGDGGGPGRHAAREAPCAGRASGTGHRLGHAVPVAAAGGEGQQSAGRQREGQRRSSSCRDPSCDSCLHPSFLVAYAFRPADRPGFHGGRRAGAA
jgi:hypothetical protein